MEANETITLVLAGVYNAIQVQGMLSHQAEISFKAGIKEVVEFVEDTDILTMLSLRKREEWKSKFGALK